MSILSSSLELEGWAYTGSFPSMASSHRRRSSSDSDCKVIDWPGLKEQLTHKLTKMAKYCYGIVIVIFSPIVRTCATLSSASTHLSCTVMSKQNRLSMLSAALRVQDASTIVSVVIYRKKVIRSLKRVS